MQKPQKADKSAIAPLSEDEGLGSLRMEYLSLAGRLEETFCPSRFNPDFAHSELKKFGLYTLANGIEREARENPESINLARKNAASAIRIIVSKWARPAPIQPEDFEFPEPISSSAARAINQIRRTLGFINSYNSFADYSDLGPINWDAACELMSIPYSYSRFPRFGLDMQIMVGHDLHRIETYLLAVERNKGESWRELVMKMVDEYKGISGKLLVAQSPESATDRLLAIDSNAALRLLDLICIAAEALLLPEKLFKSKSQGHIDRQISIDFVSRDQLNPTDNAIAQAIEKKPGIQGKELAKIVGTSEENIRKRLGKDSHLARLGFGQNLQSRKGYFPPT